MSITQLLREDHVLRAELRERFQYPRFPVQAEMLAPPRCTSYSTVGTAVDYLLRSRIEYLNPRQSELNTALVSEYAFNSLSRFLRSVGNGRVALGRSHKLILPAKKVLLRINASYCESHATLKTYAQGGLLNDEVINAALFFARLDPFYRAGVVDPGLIEPDLEAIEDVRSIMQHTPDRSFVAKKRCYLNPTFGDASAMVAGADADLIIDDLLVDIKTTKNLGVRREHLDQLLSYYVLHKIGGLNASPRVRPIKRVGIYFSRHAYLWAVPIEVLASDRELSSFTRWFQDRYRPRRRRTARISPVENDRFGNEIILNGQ